MVRPFSTLLLLCCYLLTSSNAFAITALNVSLSRPKIEYGKYVELVVSAPIDSGSGQSLNLTPLERKFHVASLRHERTTQQEQWRIRIYPRATGTVTIPVLQYGHMQSLPQILTVTPAIDSRTGHRLDIKFNVSAHNAWVNQQVVYYLSLQSVDQHVVLQTTAPKLKQGILYSIPLKTEVKPHSKPTNFEHTAGWVYQPGKPGMHHLELPAISYKRDGVITHKFFPPQIALEVSPLPSYIPTNFTVGTLSVQIKYIPSLILTKKLQYMQLEVSGHGMTPEHLPRIDAYLQSQQDLQVYPAELGFSQSISTKGMRSRATYNVPFKVSGTGLYQVAPVQLQFFDPMAGKIVKLSYTGARMVGISLWLIALTTIIFFVLAYFSLPPLLARLIRLMNIFINRRRARRLIADADTPLDIKQALFERFTEYQQHAPLTLQRIAQLKSINTESLSRALYACEQPDMDDLKSYYLSVL